MYWSRPAASLQVCLRNPPFARRLTKRRIHARLRRLATKPCEKSGLVTCNNLNATGTIDCSSAESAKQHSPGWRRPRKRALEPWGKMGSGQALKGRCRKPAPPFQGFFRTSITRLAPWAVLLRAFSAPEELAQPLAIQLLQATSRRGGRR